jgi:TPR repeat protein
MSIKDNNPHPDKALQLVTSGGSLVAQEVQRASRQLALAGRIGTQLVLNDERRRWVALLLNIKGEDAIAFLSARVPMSLDLLKSYKNFWNWSYLSCNESLPWSVGLIERFATRWNWSWLLKNESLPHSIMEQLGSDLIARKMEEFHQITDSTDTHDEIRIIPEKDALLPWSLDNLELNKDSWDWGWLARNQALPALPLNQQDIDEVIIQITKRAAKQGDVDALFLLGEMHNTGRDVPKYAAQLYEQAAAHGHAGAQYSLGLMYEKFRLDSALGGQFYELAAAQGHANASYRYTGIGQSYDKTRAAEFLTQAATQWQPDIRYIPDEMVEGIANSLLRLGERFEPDQGKAKQLIEQGLQLLEQAAAQWNACNLCLVRLADIYSSKRYTAFKIAECDEVRVLQLYEKAANQGNARAQFNTAVSYHRGKGVQPDLKMAKEWYVKACDSGHQTACLILKNEFERLN